MTKQKVYFLSDSLLMNKLPAYMITIPFAKWHKFEEGDNIEVYSGTSVLVGTVTGKGWWGDLDGWWIEFKDENEEIWYVAEDYYPGNEDFFVCREKIWLTSDWPKKAWQNDSRRNK